MDNVTHSLFGYALGRALPGRAASPARRRAGIWTGVVASNLPDFDFVAGPLASDAQLAYLLHHRGHTHTLLFALPLGALCGLLCGRVARVSDRRELQQLAGLGALACLLHIAFDALNDYGVHPFFPWNRWYYGDAVFIVEPLLLALLIPLLALAGETRAGRALGWLLFAGLFALLWLSRVLQPAHAGVLSALLLAALTAQWRFSPPAPAVLGAVAALLLVFLGASQLARAELHKAFARALPAERVLDLVTHALPGNPLCFEALALTLDPRGRYRARKGQISLAPGLIAPERCRLTRGETPTAPLARQRLELGAGTRFEQLFEADARELRALRDRDCDAGAMLRFARAPFWLEQQQRTLLGDLRYDHAPALEFAERELTGRCEDRLPHWEPPRADLLRQDR